MHLSQKTVHPFITVVCANCRKSVRYHSLGERSPEYDYCWQSYSGLHSTRRSYFNYSWNDSWVQIFQSQVLATNAAKHVFHRGSHLSLNQQNWSIDCEDYKIKPPYNFALQCKFEKSFQSLLYPNPHDVY